MAKMKVIDSKRIPSKPPIKGTVLTILALDYWNAPEWLWGCMGVLVVVAWVTFVIGSFREEKVDPFKEEL